LLDAQILQEPRVWDSLSVACFEQKLHNLVEWARRVAWIVAWHRVLGDATGEELLCDFRQFPITAKQQLAGIIIKIT
jgi:hypothetical protein